MEERFGLTSQMKRAACSIPLLVVEGCGRNTDKDFAHFLDMSLGSARELEYCLLLARDMKILKEETYLMGNERINEVKAKLINLIKALRKAERRTLSAND